MKLNKGRGYKGEMSNNAFFEKNVHYTPLYIPDQMHIHQQRKIVFETGLGQSKANFILGERSKSFGKMQHSKDRTEVCHICSQETCLSGKISLSLWRRTFMTRQAKVKFCMCPVSVCKNVVNNKAIIVCPRFANTGLRIQQCLSYAKFSPILLQCHIVERFQKLSTA